VSSAEIDRLTTSWVDANQLATATLEPNGELPGPSRKPMLSERASFWAAAGVAILAFAANAAASPLYRIYQAQFRFSVTTLTLLFAVHVFALLATLVSWARCLITWAAVGWCWQAWSQGRPGVGCS